MHKLVDYICEELDELERKADKDGKLSMAEVQYMDMLAHAKKNLLKGEEMMEGGYSMEGGSYENGRMHDGSYARNRMGRYTRGRNRGGANQYGSYNMGGYSRAEESMIEDVRSLMEEAPNEQMKHEFQRFLTKLENM